MHDETAVYRAGNQVVSDKHVFTFITFSVRTNRDGAGLVNHLVKSLESSSIDNSSNDIIVDGNVPGSLNTEADRSKIEEDVIADIDVC